MNTIELSNSELVGTNGGSEFSEMCFYFLGLIAKSGTYVNLDTTCKF